MLCRNLKAVGGPPGPPPTTPRPSTDSWRSCAATRGAGSSRGAACSASWRWPCASCTAGAGRVRTAGCAPNCLPCWPSSVSASSRPPQTDPAAAGLRPADRAAPRGQRFRILAAAAARAAGPSCAISLSARSARPVVLCLPCAAPHSSGSRNLIFRIARTPQRPLASRLHRRRPGPRSHGAGRARFRPLPQATLHGNLK